MAKNVEINASTLETYITFLTKKKQNLEEEYKEIVKNLNNTDWQDQNKNVLINSLAEIRKNINVIINKIDEIIEFARKDIETAHTTKKMIGNISNL